MQSEDRFRWPVARPFRALAELARTYGTAVRAPAVWRDLGRYAAAVSLYFAVALGGGWLWMFWKGLPWPGLPAPDALNWGSQTVNAILCLGGLTQFNPFLPLYPVCLGDAYYYFANPRSVKPVLVGRWLFGFPLYLVLAVWWYRRHGLIAGWGESLAAGAAMCGALWLYKARLGKTARQLQLPAVFTWHWLAWFVAAGYGVAAHEASSWPCCPWAPWSCSWC